MTGVALNTVVKLLVDLGTAAAEYQDATLRKLTCRRIQCDEIWSFVYAKQKNVPAEHEGELGFGDVWTWTALDSDSKLIVSWLVGRRDGETAHEFIDDMAIRLAHRVQLTTDGLKAYLEAVEDAFGAAIDYAQLVKLYGPKPEGEKRYCPSACIGAEKRIIQGQPEAQHISTSHVERQNLSMRMGMRRFTRLANAFSCLPRALHLRGRRPAPPRGGQGRPPLRPAETCPTIFVANRCFGSRDSRPALTSS